MPTYAAASIRNVAVVGHNGSGKTQLISALLFTAGATTRLGRVDDGTAPTDFDEEAIVRKHTLAATPAWLDWQGTKVNLVDTPGFGNFLSETGATLRVTDAALVVVDAVAGVEVQTERVWALAAEEQLRDSWSSTVWIASAPASRPPSRTSIRLRPDPRAGATPLRRREGFPRRHRPRCPTGLHLRRRQRTRQAVAIPESMAAEARERPGSAGGTGRRSRRRPDVAVLRRRHAQRRGTRGGTAHRRPHGRHRAGVLCLGGREHRRRSADRRPRPVHARHLSIARCLPWRRRAGNAVRSPPTTAGATRVFVWKTVADPFAGRISLFRVITGVVRNDTTLTNLTRGSPRNVSRTCWPCKARRNPRSTNCMQATSAPSRS